MTRILIVTQNFTMGGLETHILTLCKFLHKRNCKLFMATSMQSDMEVLKPYLTDVLLLDGWTSLTGENINGLCNSISTFIEKNNIEIVHVHPYESLFIGALAAGKSGVPYVVSIHSPLNLNSAYKTVYQMFVSYYLLPSAEKVYCVSYESKKAVDKFSSSATTELFVNPIDVECFPLVEWDAHKDYVLLSRIDDDKLNSIKEAIKLVSYIKQNTNDDRKFYIVGDGNSLKELKNWSSNELDSPSWLIFEGKSNNVQQYLSNAAVVFGMGRVVIEAGIMDIPVILTGYDGVKGFVNKDNIEEVAKYNFSGRNRENIAFSYILSDMQLLSDKLNHYQLGSYFFDNFGIETLGEKYLKDIERVKKKSLKPEWVKPVLNIANENRSDYIFDNIYMNHWLQHFDFGLTDQMQIMLFTSAELQKVMNENKVLTQQIGMINQNLHDLSVYKEQYERSLQGRIADLEGLLEEKEEKINELEHQNYKIADLEGKIIQLEHRNDKIEHAKKTASFKVQQLSNSKFFRVLHGLRRAKLQFIKGDVTEKARFIRWIHNKARRKEQIVDLRYHPLNEISQLLDNDLVIHSEQVIKEDIEGFEASYQARKRYYESFLNGPLSQETLQIIEAMKNKKYKAVVVYSSAVKWEPVQRPQQLLRELASRGYLCFFCNNSPGEDGGFYIQEKEKNLFIINKEEYLLPVLHSKSVIVLCSWLMQMAWADLLPHKFLWYDILDKVEFFSLYDKDMQKRHEIMVEKADLVSYSARQLQSYVVDRQDAFYLPNAACFQDFLKVRYTPEVPTVLRNIIRKDKPIIGYFGAIEEWFDASLIEGLARQHSEWEFVLIGKSGLPAHRLQGDNIHLLGQIPYTELASYAQFFKVAIIPFIVNDLTHCVSPVKFFEYKALGLPVVSTPIEEMKQYEGQFLTLAQDVCEFEKAICHHLSVKDPGVTKQDHDQFLKENSWAARIDKVEGILKQCPAAWKVFSNADIRGVAVLAATFLDFEGSNFYSGGAERYLIDLAEVCADVGTNLTIYQYGNFPWMRKFRNINVISLSRQGNSAHQLTVESIMAFNRTFYEQVQNRSVLNIYSAFFEAWPISASPSIGISHGVAWDNPYAVFDSGNDFWKANQRFIESAKLCDKIISVDTNTANWFQTIDYPTGNKMSVIPNYVDLEEFHPRENFNKTDEKVVILYPRRLYEARGLYIVLEILDDILSRFSNVEFHFVGKGFEEDTKHVVEKQKKWGERVRWYSLPPEEMPIAYHHADISLVPTMYSEGTSLSCLEAMASGNAVISTRIGGLTDLVIDNYNGYLIQPSANALKQAIEKLLTDREKLTAFKKRGREVASVFSKKNWKVKWMEVIEELKENDRQNNIDHTRMVEIYINKIPERESLRLFGEMLINLLSNGDLIYIFSKDDRLNKQESFDRLQWMKWGDEGFSRPDVVMADEGSAKIIDKKVDRVIDFLKTMK